MAGQLMRGTTGKLVRNTAGGLVRTDDLYKTVMPWYDECQWAIKRGSSYGAVYSPADITFDRNWSYESLSGCGAAIYAWMHQKPYSTSSWLFFNLQKIRRHTKTIPIDIDADRIEKAVITWRLVVSANSFDVGGFGGDASDVPYPNCSLYYIVGDYADPTGSADEPWDVGGWNYLSTVNVFDKSTLELLDSGHVDVPRNGNEIDVSFALFFEAADANDKLSTVSQGVNLYLSSPKCDLVYNLAP